MSTQAKAAGLTRLEREQLKAGDLLVWTGGPYANGEVLIVEYREQWRSAVFIGRLCVVGRSEPWVGTEFNVTSERLRLLTANELLILPAEVVFDL